MTTKPTRKILVPPELQSSALGAFFIEQGFELHLKFINGHDYLFAVDNACPQVLDLPRLKTTDKMNVELLPMVRSYISEDYFTSVTGKKLLASYFNDGLEFDLVDRYSKDFKNIYTVKVHEYLNVGYFTDQIIVEAYKGKFDINALRNYLNAAMNFAFKKVEVSNQSMPIDVSYSHNQDAFTVQISMEVDAFLGISELSDQLEVLIKNSNFFDVNFFVKKNRLTISSLVFKDKKPNMSAYFFSEISKKEILDESDEKSALLSGLENKENLEYEAQKIPDEQSKKLALARKFAIFIKNYRSTEENPKDTDKLVVADVEEYLAKYPKQKSLDVVDDEIKNFILKLLKNDQLFDGISDYVKKISSENLDSQVGEIQRVLGGKSLDDIEEILIVGGAGNGQDGVSRVKGWVEDGDDSKWEVKKGQINEKIQNEMVRISSQGKNIVESDIIRIVAGELDANEKDVKVVVNGIVEEVVSRELVKKQKLEDALALKILTTQSAEGVREKLESQIFRMKKIMDGLKHEIIKLQNEKAERIAADKEMSLQNSDQSEELKLRAALAKTMDTLKLKERFIEKMKTDNETLSKIKDQKTEVLAEKIEEMKADYAKSKEFANEEKLKIIEAENKSLTLRLDHANKKVNIINENIENRENESLGKREKEVDTLKANLQVAQTVIERFKQDKIEMELRYNVEKEAFRKLRDEKGSSGVSKEELLEKDMALSGAITEKKLLEEKFRAQAIELKKLEQKLKFAASQLETASKRKSSAPAGQKSPEALQKLLDLSNSRLAETSSEMTEKRKEAIKLKQENIMMSNRIAELEKKLALADKKAA